VAEVCCASGIGVDVPEMVCFAVFNKDLKEAAIFCLVEGTVPLTGRVVASS
jgi:hypothetical protein